MIGEGIDEHISFKKNSDVFDSITLQKLLE